MSTENIFGKQRGRFDERAASEAQRSLIDQMMGAFHSMPLEMQMLAVQNFNQTFGHPHRDVRFRIEWDGL